MTPDPVQTIANAQMAVRLGVRLHNLDVYALLTILLDAETRAGHAEGCGAGHDPNRVGVVVDARLYTCTCGHTERLRALKG